MRKKWKPPIDRNPRLARTEAELDAQLSYATAAERLFNVARLMMGTASLTRAMRLVEAARKQLDAIELACRALPSEGSSNEREDVCETIQEPC